jgi:hypothetical protein
MRTIPKKMPLLIGPWGIAKIEGMTVHGARSRFRRKSFPIVHVARHRARVESTYLLEKWGEDTAPHLARIDALPAELDPEDAAWELSMPLYDFEQLDLVNADGTVDKEDLLAFLHSHSLTSA